MFDWGLTAVPTELVTVTDTRYKVNGRRSVSVAVVDKPCGVVTTGEVPSETES